MCQVKKGDYILLSSYAMGRSKGIWNAPMRFDPDRFSEENVDEVIPEDLNEEERLRFKRRIKVERLILEDASQSLSYESLYIIVLY